MMYCTVAQLEDRLTVPVLGQRVPETGTDRLRVLTGYIERASAHIDSRLAVKHAVPAPPSPLLADICLTICLWQIEADRGASSDKLPSRVQTPYDEAMKTLTDLATGKIDLPGLLPAEGTVAGLAVQSPRGYFHPDTPGMGFF